MMKNFFQWFENKETLVWLVSSFSLVMLLAFLVGVPFIIIRLPADYFQKSHSLLRKKDGRSVSGIIWLILKNMAGIVFLVAGIAMLFLPGQGLLSMIVGLSMLDIPYKRRILRSIIREQHVLGSLNRLRTRFGKRPFRV